MTINLKRMTAGYIECAEWVDCGTDHETHGHNFSPELLTKMVNDCMAFIEACGPTIIETIAERAPGYSDERFGHDFWLTRNGHGAGYWDRTELDIAYMSGAGLKNLGDELTKLAHSAGACELYLGDDGEIYA